MSNNKVTPLDFNNFDFSRLEYCEPKKDGSVYTGSIYYRVSNNRVDHVYIKTPKLKTVGGIIKQGNRCFIEFEFDQTQEHRAFYNFLSKIDEYNCEISYRNRESWFQGQDMPRDVIDDFYRKPITTKENHNSPVFKVKVPIRNNVILPKIYNHPRTSVDYSYITPGDEVMAVLVLEELRFTDKHFTCQWIVAQLKTFKTINRDTLVDDYLLEEPQSEEQTEDKQTEETKGKEDEETPVEENRDNEEEVREETKKEEQVEELETKEQEEEVKEIEEMSLEENQDNEEEEDEEPKVEEYNFEPVPKQKSRYYQVDPDFMDDLNLADLEEFPISNNPKINQEIIQELTENQNRLEQALEDVNRLRTQSQEKEHQILQLKSNVGKLVQKLREASAS